MAFGGFRPHFLYFVWFSGTFLVLFRLSAKCIPGPLFGSCTMWSDRIVMHSDPGGALTIYALPWCANIKGVILTKMQEKGFWAESVLSYICKKNSMFSTKKFQEKGCLFHKFCKRKGMVSEAALAHPCTKIRGMSPPPRTNVCSNCVMWNHVIFYSQKSSILTGNLVVYIVTGLSCIEIETALFTTYMYRIYVCSNCIMTKPLRFCIQRTPILTETL